MKPIRKVSILGIAAVLSVTLAQTAQGQRTEPPTPTSVPATPSKSVPASVDGIREAPPIDADLYAQYAKENGISVADALAAFEDSKPITDFLIKHKTDPLFGYIGATYSGGSYEVILRITSDKGLPLVTELQKGLKGNLRVKQGGRSSLEVTEALNDAAAMLGSLLGDVQLRSNPDGEVVVLAEANTIPQIAKLAIPGIKLQQGSVSKPAPVVAPGNSKERRLNPTSTSWQHNCTVSYAIRRLSDNHPGFVTAGHCDDAAWAGPYMWMGRTTNGEYLWQAEQVNCGNASGGFQVDAQLHPILSNLGQFAGSIYHVAGAYWDTQPAYRLGYHTTATSTVSAAHSFNPVNGSLAGDCPTMTSVGGFLMGGTTPIGGDSGGPVYVAYGGQWYLAGITSAPWSAGGTTVSDILYPSGWRICTQYAPC